MHGFNDVTILLLLPTRCMNHIIDGGHSEQGIQCLDQFKPEATEYNFPSDLCHRSFLTSSCSKIGSV